MDGTRHQPFVGQIVLSSYLWLELACVIVILFGNIVNSTKVVPFHAELRQPTNVSFHKKMSQQRTTEPSGRVLQFYEPFLGRLKTRRLSPLRGVFQSSTSAKKQIGKTINFSVMLSVRRYDNQLAGCALSNKSPLPCDRPLSRSRRFSP
jgi:hypothetical protein